MARLRLIEICLSDQSIIQTTGGLSNITSVLRTISSIFAISMAYASVGKGPWDSISKKGRDLLVYSTSTQLNKWSSSFVITVRIIYMQDFRYNDSSCR